MRGRVRVPDVVVAGGVVLLVASFLPWYGLEHGIFVTGGEGGGPWVRAWSTPAWWVPVLAGAALAALWLLRRLGRVEASWLPAVTVAVGVLGLVLVVAEAWSGAGGGGTDFGWYAYAPLTDDPGGFAVGPRAGLFLALAALAAQVAAGAWALRRPAA